MFRSLGFVLSKGVRMIQPTQVAFTMVPKYSFAGGKKDKKKEQKQEQAKQKLNIRQSLANAKEIDLESMEKSFISIQKTYQGQIDSLKPGKIDISIFDNISTKVSGQTAAISELGQIVQTQNQGCIISPYVFQNMDDIAKTLQTSQYGFQVQKKGTQIILNLAGANTKQAKDLIAKKAKQEFQQGKQKLNKQRNKHHEQIKKYKKIANEDVVRRSQQQLQKIYQKVIKDLQTSYKNKVKEVSK